MTTGSSTSGGLHSQASTQPTRPPRRKTPTRSAGIHRTPSSAAMPVTTLPAPVPPPRRARALRKSPPSPAAHRSTGNASRVSSVRQSGGHRQAGTTHTAKTLKNLIGVEHGSKLPNAQSLSSGSDRSTSPKRRHHHHRRHHSRHRRKK